MLCGAYYVTEVQFFKKLYMCVCHIVNQPLPVHTYNKYFSRYMLTTSTYCIICSSAPVETLHTILLGPYKYLLNSAIRSSTSLQKKQLLVRISTFNYSGFKGKVLGNIVSYHRSFVGRDYKAWAQMAPFVMLPYLSEGEREVWINLSKVYI